jgi:predicted site-specific integrase-resolvase
VVAANERRWQDGQEQYRPSVEWRKAAWDLLSDVNIEVIVVEHRDRATRFGLTYIEQLMAMQGRRLEVIFPSDTGNDLVDDFIAIITSMASRIYGRRASKKRAEKIKQCVEQAMKEEYHERDTWLQN